MFCREIFLPGVVTFSYRSGKLFTTPLFFAFYQGGVFIISQKSCQNLGFWTVGLLRILKKSEGGAKGDAKEVRSDKVKPNLTYFASPFAAFASPFTPPSHCFGMRSKPTVQMPKF